MVDNARRAVRIYGPDVLLLKGKTTRGDAVHIPTQVPSLLPSPILEDHANVTLCADFFVQGMPFFRTISRKIKFCTVSAVKNLKCKTIKIETNHALKLYQARGFNVVDIHGDMEFECVQHDFLLTTVNLTPCDVHVGEVECSIQTIKEQVRANVHGMPFKRLPKIMIVKLVRQAVILLNIF